MSQKDEILMSGFMRDIQNIRTGISNYSKTSARSANHSVPNNLLVSHIISSLLLVSNIMIENPWFVYISGCNKHAHVHTYILPTHPDIQRKLFDVQQRAPVLQYCCLLCFESWCMCIQACKQQIEQFKFNWFFSLLYEWIKIFFSKMMFFLLVFDVKSIHFPHSCIILSFNYVFQQLFNYFI